MRTSARALISIAICSALVGAAADTAAAALQYPDLETLPPRDLKIDRADISDDGSGNFHNVLRFSNTVWNDGDGKLVMRGNINATTKDGGAFQRVYDENGSFQDFPVGRFYWHAEHSHYHYDNWGRYQLFTKAEYDSWVAQGRPRTLPSGVEIGTKTTSCVMDEEFITTKLNTPWPAVFPSSGCMPDSSNNLLEGISSGWGDTYDYYRYEQWIDLGQGQLTNGDYVLRSVTDEVNQIHESPNKADGAREGQLANEAITRFKVQNGVLVDSNPPSGTIAINDVDAQTTTAQVTVKALGRDDILGPRDAPGVDTVRLSNNGTTWKQFSYTGQHSNAQSIAWNLTDATAGGTPGGGTKTVYAQFRDRVGNWSPTTTDTISLKLPSATKYAQAVLADNPVSFWRLAEAAGTQALDERNANHGAYLGSPTLNAPSLLAGEADNKAVRFDGTNDAVSVPYKSSLNMTNAISVEAWIKPNALPASGRFASVVTRPESYSIQFNGARLEWTVMQNGTRQRLQAASGAIVAGQTYHVVGTFDGATQRLYLNGTQVGSRALSGNATTNSQGLYIGSWYADEYFNGTIDDVAIYRSVLSAARVQAHTTAAGGGTTPPPPPPTLPAPSGLTATPASPYAVDVRWTDNASSEENYVLERSTSSSFSSPRTVTLAANTRTFVDSGLNASTTYHYRVKATAGTASSAWSAPASTTTPAPPTTNSYSQVVLGDGPSSYWRVGETSGTTASDQKTTNPGTYEGSPSLGQTSLLVSDTQNRSVGLFGWSDVRVPAAPSLNLTSAVTLEAWIKPASIPAVGFASLISKAEAYSLQFNSGRLELTIIQNGVRRRLQAPAGAIAAGNAYHVVGTFDGATQRLYVNGVQVASAALSGAATIYGSDLYIGSWDGWSEFFNGTIDEPAVYARVLTAAQVKSHYDSGVAQPATGSALSAPVSAPVPAEQPTTTTAAAAAPAPAAPSAQPVAGGSLAFAPVAPAPLAVAAPQQGAPAKKPPKKKAKKKCVKPKKGASKAKKRAYKKCRARAARRGR